MKTILRLLSPTEAEFYDLQQGRLIARSKPMHADISTGGADQPDAVIIAASLLAWGQTTIDESRIKHDRFHFADRTAHNATSLTWTRPGIGKAGTVLYQAWIDSAHLDRLFTQWRLASTTPIFAEPLCLRAEGGPVEWWSGALPIRSVAGDPVAEIFQQSDMPRAQTLPRRLIFDSSQGRFLANGSASAPTAFLYRTPVVATLAMAMMAAGGVMAKLGSDELLAQRHVERITAETADLPTTPATRWLGSLAPLLRNGSLERIEIDRSGHVLKLDLSVAPAFDRDGLAGLVTDANIGWREEDGRILIELARQQETGQ